MKYLRFNVRLFQGHFDPGIQNIVSIFPRQWTKVNFFDTLNWIKIEYWRSFWTLVISTNSSPISIIKISLGAGLKQMESKTWDSLVKWYESIALWNVIKCHSTFHLHFDAASMMQYWLSSYLSKHLGGEHTCYSVIQALSQLFPSQWHDDVIIVKFYSGQLISSTKP